jgi:hypothetical protein
MIEQNEATTEPNDLRKRIVQSFEEFDVHFRENHPVSWAVTLIGPLVLTAAILALIWIYMGFKKVVALLVAELITFVFLGRFVIVFGSEQIKGYGRVVPPTSAELFAMVTYMDLVVAFVFIFHMGFLFRLPVIGKKVGALVIDGKFILDKQPWMKRVAFIGLVLFVVFPTSTTGSIGGSIFGRLLGLTRLNTFFAIALGSILGNGIMWVLAKQVQQYIDPNNIWYKILGIVIVVALVVIIEWRYRKLKNKYMTESSDSNKNEIDSVRS